MRLVPVLSLLSIACVIPWLATSEADAGRRDEGRQPLRISPRIARQIELGRRLFYDPSISQSGTQACVDCHDPEYGFSDRRRFSLDERGQTPRHSQPILDTASNPSTHWDGEFSKVEDAITARIGRPLVQKYYGIEVPVPPPTTPRPTPPRGGTGPASPTTPRPPAGPAAGPLAGPTPLARPTSGASGVPVLPATPAPVSAALAPPPARATSIDETVAKRVERSKRYAEAFTAVFGTTSVSVRRIAKVMAQYCHSIQSTESAYDRYAHGDPSALNASAKRGLALFRGRAGCVSCHALAGDHPLLTDYAFHNTGIVWARRQEEGFRDDQGRGRITQSERDLRAFKTPTLRDASRRGPYMHDGRLAKLEDVVRYYAAGGSADPQKDKRLQGFEASDQAVADLVAFLGSLTGTVRPGLAESAWRVRPETQRLRFVNPAGKPLVGLDVRLVPHGDRIPVAGRRTPDTSLDLTVERKDGWVSFAPSARTHVELQIENGDVDVAIPLVPDTLRRARIVVPLEGKIQLTLSARSEAHTPRELTAAPIDARRTAARRRRGPIKADGKQAMQLRRISLVKLGSRVVARYEGWLPSGWQKRTLVLQMDAGYRPNDPAELSFSVDPAKDAHARLDLPR